MNFNLYLSALLLAATACSAFVVYLCWKRRELPIAVSYGLGILTTAFYSIGYASELVSTSLESIRFWLRVEYIGIPFGTVFWMIMVLQYTGRELYIRKWTIALAMVIPVITFIAHNTNEWHHLFYRSLTLDYSEGIPLARIVRGPLYLLHAAYSYLLIIIGSGMLLQMYFKSEPRLKKQVGFMLIGSCAPYGFTLIYLSGVLHTPFDISPFGFVLSSIFFLLGIYQFNLLRLAPMALQKVFESMQDAVLLLDPDDNISGYNQAASRAIPGLGRKNGIGLPAASVLGGHPEIRRIALGDDEPARVLDLSSGFYYQVQLSAIHDYRFKVTGKMLILRDVTSAVLSEERLRENARQLSELNAFKDQMFNVVAHDIRDPVAVLMNLMELLEESEEWTQDQEELVHEMGLQVRSLFSLVESLLEWFRSQRSGMKFAPVNLSLEDAASRSIRQFQSRSEGKGIQIVSTIPASASVNADKDMLDLILRNLLSNAIKFTEAGGRITLDAVRSGDKTIVAVRDSGLGVPEESVPTLLEDSLTAPSQGTAGERGVGIGLTLCKEFVRLSGGELWFDSIPGKGSSFYFTMPAANDGANTLAAREIG